MEEKNLQKEAPMTEQNKLSYEELENVALKLQEQCKNLYMQNQELQAGLMFKRLDYLFKTLEYYSLLESDFVKKCAKEIQEILTIEPKTEE